MENIYNIALCCFTNFFRVFIIWRFIKIFFNTKKIDTKIESIAYGTFYLVTTSLYLLFYYPLINMLSFLIGIFLITLVYMDSLKKKILITVLIYSVNMVCDYVIIMLFVNYQIGKIFNQWYEVLVVLLTLLCELIVEKLIMKKQVTFVTNKTGLLMIIPLCSITMLHFLFKNIINQNFIIAIVSIGLLNINIIVFYLYYLIVDAYNQQREKEKLEQEIKIYSNQIKNIMFSETKIRSLQHDMKHHINALGILAKQNDNNKLIEYLIDIKGEIENKNEVLYSGNKDIDGILNYIMQDANESLKNVNIKVNVPREPIIGIYNLTIILGNLLENAITAAKISKDKKLEVKITLNKGILFIKIRNSFNGEVIRQGEKWITTKEEKELHGIGLENVQRIVDENNGSIKVCYDNNIFDVTVMLYTSNK